MKVIAVFFIGCMVVAAESRLRQSLFLRNPTHQLLYSLLAQHLQDNPLQNHVLNLKQPTLPQVPLNSPKYKEAQTLLKKLHGDLKENLKNIPPLSLRDIPVQSAPQPLLTSPSLQTELIERLLLKLNKASTQKRHPRPTQGLLVFPLLVNGDVLSAALEPLTASSNNLHPLDDSIQLNGNLLDNWFDSNQQSANSNLLSDQNLSDGEQLRSGYRTLASSFLHRFGNLGFRNSGRSVLHPLDKLSHMSTLDLLRDN